MPTNQEWFPAMLGVMPSAVGYSAGTLALNAANTQIAFSFIAPYAAANKTLSKVKLFTSAIAGTQANIASTLNLCADASGVPNSGTIVETETVSNVAAGWWEWTGFSTELTGGVRYWLIVKNTAVDPTTDYPTVQWIAANSVNYQVSGSGSTWGIAKVSTTDGGSTWATGALNGYAGIRLEFSDGSFMGAPFSAAGSTATGYPVYSTRELGNLITTPANGKLNIRGVCMPLRKNGTPAADVVYKLYNGTTLIGTTHEVPRANFGTYLFMPATFQAAVEVAPSTSLRVVFAMDADAGDSSNYYYIPGYTIEDNADSKALVPYGAQATYYTGSWAQTSTLVLPFALLLDTDSEFGTNSVVVIED